MRTGFVVETIREGCSCDKPRHYLLDGMDEDLFQDATENKDHFIDEGRHGYCPECKEDLTIDIHFVVTNKQQEE